jgi:hypothetical protein
VFVNVAAVAMVAVMSSGIHQCLRIIKCFLGPLRPVFLFA